MQQVLKIINKFKMPNYTNLSLLKIIRLLIYHSRFHMHLVIKVKLLKQNALFKFMIYGVLMLALEKLRVIK